MSGKQPADRSVIAIRDAVRERIGTRDLPLLVAIDGGSGAGKSTLTAALAPALAASVVDGDDFYAGGTAAEWDARSPAANADHCIDWRRLRSEALELLLQGRAASWHPFDWRPRGGLLATLTRCESSAVVILDGAYSARPELGDLVDLAVLVDAPADERRRRVVARESPMDETWFARWDAAERYYFTKVRPPAWFDLIVSTGAAFVSVSRPARSAAQTSSASHRPEREQHEHEPRHREDR